MCARNFLTRPLMFGKNVVSKIDHDRPDELFVESIFYTLQGEGPFSGMPSVFIRLAGCPLRCTFCDTQFDTGLTRVPMGVEEIVQAVVGASPDAWQRDRLVVITGGEPLRQDISALVYALWDADYDVQIETAGIAWPERMGDVMRQQGRLGTHRLDIVCSPKTPTLNPHIMQWTDHYKYVVRAGETDERGLPSVNPQTGAPMISPLPGLGIGRTVWISPCDDHDNHRNVANTVHARDICLKHGYRLSLQVHKIVSCD